MFVVHTKTTTQFFLVHNFAASHFLSTYFSAVILFLSLNLPALVIRRHCLSPHKLLWSYRRDRRDTCQCLNRCRARTLIWVNVLSSPAGQIISINIYIYVCVCSSISSSAISALLSCRWVLVKAFNQQHNTPAKKNKVNALVGVGNTNRRKGGIKKKHS